MALGDIPWETLTADYADALRQATGDTHIFVLNDRPLVSRRTLIRWRIDDWKDRIGHAALALRGRPCGHGDW